MERRPLRGGHGRGRLLLASALSGNAIHVLSPRRARRPRRALRLFHEPQAGRRAGEAERLAFPFDIRLLMQGWNLFFLERGVFRPIRRRAHSWNRGAYLADGTRPLRRVPHAARPFRRELETANAFAGAVANGLSAPDIRAATLKASRLDARGPRHFLPHRRRAERLRLRRDVRRHQGFASPSHRGRPDGARGLPPRRARRRAGKGEAAVAAAPPSGGDAKGAASI